MDSKSSLMLHLEGEVLDDIKKIKGTYPVIIRTPHRGLVEEDLNIYV